MTLIDDLKGMIKEVHGMDPNYSEYEDNEQYYAHPSWTMNLNLSEFKDRNERSTSSPIDLQPGNTPPCQTPRECQTRSTELLKKPSMKQSTQQTSAISELNLPQFGSEDADEAWLTELIGSEATGPREAAKQAYIQAW